MASVKCGVTAQAVIHHYHRSETGITIINVKLRWTLSTLNINEMSQTKKQNLPYITQIDRVKWKNAQSVGIYNIPISPWSWPSRAKAGIVSIPASTVIFCPPSYTLPVRRSVHVMLAFPGSVTSRDLAPASTTGATRISGPNMYSSAISDTDLS